MKATLEFNDEEREQLQLAIDGWEWRQVVNDILDKLRDEQKYQDHEVIGVDEMETFILETVSDRGLFL